MKENLQRPSWITGDIFTAASGYGSLKAWEPWDWTVSCLFDLQNSDIDDEHPEWRINWIAGVAMLRTVGHVLKNVDSRTSGKHTSIITEYWKTWQHDKDLNWIFFDFIEQERNNILKEFSFGATLPAVNDGRVLAYGNTQFDAAQLFREAVYWWRHQLRSIEKDLSES